jgi:hypothetical protein
MPRIRPKHGAAKLYRVFCGIMSCIEIWREGRLNHGAKEQNATATPKLVEHGDNRQEATALA